MRAALITAAALAAAALASLALVLRLLWPTADELGHTDAPTDDDQPIATK